MMGLSTRPPRFWIMHYRSPLVPSSPYNARLHPTPYTAPMRIYMQTNAPPGEAPRYVQLELQQDLLGSWLLNRESGRQGGRVTLKKQVYLDHGEALKAFESARDQQIKRGFKVMFAKGTDSPHG